MMVYLYRRTVSSSMSDLIHLNIQGLCVFLAQAKVLRCYSVIQIHKFFVFWQVFKQPKEPDQFGGTLKRLP